MTGRIAKSALGYIVRRHSNLTSALRFLSLRRQKVNWPKRKTATRIIAQFVVVFYPEIKQSLDVYEGHFTLLLRPSFLVRILSKTTKCNKQPHVFVAQ